MDRVLRKIPQSAEFVIKLTKRNKKNNKDKEILGKHIGIIQRLLEKKMLDCGLDRQKIIKKLNTSTDLYFGMTYNIRMLKN